MEKISLVQKTQLQPWIPSQCNLNVLKLGQRRGHKMIRLFWSITMLRKESAEMKALMTLTFMVTTSFHAKSTLKRLYWSNKNINAALQNSSTEFQTYSLHFHAIKTYDFWKEQATNGQNGPLFWTPWVTTRTTRGKVFKGLLLYKKRLLLPSGICIVVTGV